MVRSVLVKDTLELQERVDKCAEGAALMTGTTFERIFVDGTANAIPNMTLEKLLYSNMEYVPMPEYTEEERAFAAELDAQCPPSNEVPGTGAQFDTGIREKVWRQLADACRAVQHSMFHCALAGAFLAECIMRCFDNRRQRHDIRCKGSGMFRCRSVRERLTYRRCSCRARCTAWRRRVYVPYTG